MLNILSRIRLRYKFWLLKKKCNKSYSESLKNPIFKDNVNRIYLKYLTYLQQKSKDIDKLNIENIYSAEERAKLVWEKCHGNDN